MKKTGVLLINLGTPDSPSTPDVRKYLREFLMDKRVIDIPIISRFFLINGIIAPFRAPKSSAVYKELWDEKGSPLLYYGIEIKELLQERLGKDYVVSFGMRYQNPSIKDAVKELTDQAVTDIVVIPLFPQYASASTGSAIEETMDHIKKLDVIPSVRFISKFFEHPLFIRAFAELGKKYLKEETYDHFLFTYHGLPERQVRKSSVEGYCQLNQKCCSSYNKKNQYCYRAQSFETTRLLVKELGIPEEKYSIVFQSRLGKSPWIKPYADHVIPELAKKGIKKILCFSPSFVADCLETTIEGGVEYRDLFFEHGGDKWQLVESLNDSERWVECLEDMVKNKQ